MRSPTAEKVYKDDERFNVKSAGLIDRSPNRFSVRTILWADLILVMDQSQKDQILERYKGHPELPPIKVLGIPDNFEYMDKKLIKIISRKAESVIENFCNESP